MPLSDIVFHIYTCQPSLLGQRKLWTKFAPAGPHLRVFILNRGQPEIPNQLLWSFEVLTSCLTYDGRAPRELYGLLKVE